MTLVLASPIFGPAFNDPRVVSLLDDAAYFRALLDVEAALARVQARLGIIPEAAAEAIRVAASSVPLDASALAAGVLRDGVPTLALVALLRAAVGTDAAPYVHWGVTSQDVMDTATVACLGAALAHVEHGLVELLRQLAALAEQHQLTVMAARTHGQQALPTTFGYKVASWAAPLLRHRERLTQLLPRLCVVQLGGAAGTLSALGPRALELAQGLAGELGLGVPELPWHAQRDSFAELAAWSSACCGSLGKLAQDVILLSQSEVAELAESSPGQRGSSSSMPHKNNPMRSECILAAARSATARLSAVHQALVQEHERGTHGWQLEWLELTPLLLLLAGALRNAQLLVGELEVYPRRMRENLAGAHGLVLSEAIVEALSSHVPRPRAQELVRAAAARAVREQRQLVDVVREELVGVLPHDPIDWQHVGEPEHHLGQAQHFTARVVRLVQTLSPRPTTG